MIERNLRVSIRQDQASGSELSSPWITFEVVVDFWLDLDVIFRVVDVC